MSRENVELTRRAVDAYNRRDLDAWLALMDDEVETVSRLVAIEGGYHGHGGARRWWEQVFEAFPDLTAEVVEVRDLGDLTLTEQRMHGHSAGSHTPFEETLWAGAEWRGKKCVWWGAYRTDAEALEAVGRRG